LKNRPISAPICAISHLTINPERWRSSAGRALGHQRRQSGRPVHWHWLARSRTNLTAIQGVLFNPGLIKSPINALIWATCRRPQPIAASSGTREPSKPQASHPLKSHQSSKHRELSATRPPKGRSGKRFCSLVRPALRRPRRRCRRRSGAGPIGSRSHWDLAAKSSRWKSRDIRAWAGRNSTFSHKVLALKIPRPFKFCPLAAKFPIHTGLPPASRKLRRASSFQSRRAARLLRVKLRVGQNPCLFNAPRRSSVASTSPTGRIPLVRPDG